MRIKAFIKHLDRAKKRVTDEIIANGASGGKYARGLANEGFAGGYQQALYDIEAVLTHGYPSDSRGYWREFIEARDKELDNDQK